MNLQSLVIGAVCLPSRLGMLIFPRQKRLAAKAKVALRKEELAAGASERYFEEGRSLDAYPLPTTDTRWQIKGAFFTVLGLALLLLGYAR